MRTDAYDELPYDDYCFPLTHPERLWASARAWGHEAPAWRSARVLEVGCARGYNLLALAAAMPEAHFTGIDRSEKQLAVARQRAQRLGLRNVSLHAASLESLPEELGPFDYIVAHGVYSWVPPEVREALLRLCAKRLAPGGVAYVSFNTLPGWHALRSVRDLLRFGVEPRLGVRERVAAARAVLGAFAQGLAAQTGAYPAWLRQELAVLLGRSDSYLAHEYLSEHNEACYLTEFAGAAQGVGLAYLCDADPARSLAPPGAPTQGVPWLALEQARDFELHRRFRAALLVRGEEHRGRLARPRLEGLCLATRAELAQDAEEDSLRTDAPLRFLLEDTPFTVGDPLAKSALATLCEARLRPVPYAELCERAADRADVPAKLVPEALARWLEGWLLDGTLELYASEARYATAPLERPAGAHFARIFAEDPGPLVTLRHAQLDVDGWERAVLRLLDGTRDRAALREAATALVYAGELALGSIPDAAAVESRCEEALRWLALNALLQ